MPEVAAKPFKSAIGFVDWNTAVIASGAKIRAKRVATITERALEHVERVVADHLVGSGAGSKFQVRLRLYAGWHSGTTPSDYLQGIASVTEGYARRARSYREDRVVFLGGHDGLQPGNRLALVPRRLAPKHGVHLLDTAAISRRGSAREDDGHGACRRSPRPRAPEGGGPVCRGLG